MQVALPSGSGIVLRCTSAQYPDMEADLLSNAEQVRLLASKQLGHELDYGDQAVIWLDHYIEQQRESASSAQLAVLPDALGSFFGECLRRRFGGIWFDDELYSWSIQINPTVTVHPFAKVEKQLARAGADTVLKFYTSLPELLDKLAQLDKLPQVKPWWKFWQKSETRDL